MLKHIISEIKIAIEEQAALPDGDAARGLSPLATADGISPSVTYRLLNLLYCVNKIDSILHIM